MFRQILSRVAKGSQTEQAATGAKILIVDDDPLLRDLMRAWLEGRNYRVVVAANGREGVDLAGQERPDAIILDGNMPEMDGIEALKRIRRQRALARTPVIMLTARSREGDVLTGFRHGAQRYLTKPVSVDEVANALQEVLKGSR